MLVQTQIKKCQNCQNGFTIAPEDFAFYEKIKVPPPTWCPVCRMKRRMSFLNERTLYKRKCDLCQNDFISVFSSEYSGGVYCPRCWWSDDWDPMSYGRDYDFSRPFFQQWQELMHDLPQLGISQMHTTLVNSDYTNIVSYLKNCYLVFNSDYDEDSLYSTYLEKSKNCLDMYMGIDCELCYENTNTVELYKSFFCTSALSCVDIVFSRHVRGCSNCFGCVNLHNKKYHIFNKPYSKERYFEEMKKYDLGSYKSVLELKKQVEDFYLLFPHKFARQTQSVNVNGQHIFRSKNIHMGYELIGVEDSKHCQFLFVPPTFNSYDVTMWGSNLTYGYECMGAGGGEENIKFSIDCWAEAMNLDYCYHILVKNSDLFGCIGVRNKQYCILNKQYSKEHFDKLRTDIIRHMNERPYMDKKGRIYRYGEFFPPEISPFAYNESLAQTHFPLDETEAEEQGLRWKSAESKNYKITLKAADMPNHVKDTTDSILEETIGCAHEGACNEQCTSAFRIVPQELEFHRRHNLALPRLCPNCRHYQRKNRLNPIKFWHRRCQCGGAASENGVYKNTTNHPSHTPNQPCSNEFETSYSPQREEIIYCEECYQEEVA